jgi:O-antigen/teichoic acid export membrane protein
VKRLDRAVAYAIFARLWSLGSSLLTLYLIVRLLSPAEQGYYYTFSSLLGVQILFELGMGVVVTHFASHSMAQLHWTDDGTIAGDPTEAGRLGALVRLVVRWYGLISLVVVTILGPAGWLFLHFSPGDPSVHWLLPWVLLVGATAMNLFIQPLMSLLEGCQYIGQIARIRLLQVVLGSIASWITLILGGGLYVLAVWSFVTAVTGMTALAIERGAFFRQMLGSDLSGGAALSWRREIWPFQWRIAVSWISGYFIFQLFVPVIFATRGAVEAGKLGLGLAVSGALMNVPLAWFNTRVPMFGQLIARRDYPELDRLWGRTTLLTLVLYGSGAVFLAGAVFVLQALDTKVGARFLPASLLGVLLLATGANYFMIVQAAYLRAHKEEPFLTVSVAYGVLVTLSTFALANAAGTSGVLYGYLVCSIICGCIWGNRIFVTKRRSYRLAA